MRLPAFVIGTLMTFNVMAQEGAITLNIENIEKPEGNIIIAVFDKPDFWLDSKPKEEPFRAITLAVENTDAVEVLIEALPKGSYAISVFQDLNVNDKLDTNFIGFPKEPFGFSVPMGKFGPPSFEKASVGVDGDKHSISIKLN